MTGTSYYQLYRLDRNRHGGGIMVCVSSSLSCKVLLKYLPLSVFVESSITHLCKNNVFIFLITLHHISFHH